VRKLADIGIKLGVDGEREFKRSLSEINSAFKVLSSEMTLVTSEFGKNDKSIQAITARNSVLNKGIDAQKDKISLLKDALNNSAESFGENDKRTQAWATKLNYAQADLNKMEKELGENESALQSSGEAAQGTAQSLEQFENFTVEAQKQTSTFGDTLKALAVWDIIKAGLSTVTDGVKNMTLAMKESITSAASYGDNILTMSQKTGIGTKNLQEFSAISELVDVSLETMTNSMAKNIKSMSSAQGGTSSAAKAYKKLSISVTDSNGQLRDGEAVYWDTINALGSVTNETERDAIAMNLLEKSAQELNPLIAQGAEGLSNLTEYAYQMGAVLSGDALNSLSAMDDQFQIFGKTMESTANLVGAAFAPMVTEIMNGTNLIAGSFNQMIAAIVNGGNISAATDTFTNTLTSIVEKIAEAVPKFLEIGTVLITTLGAGISQALPSLLPVIQTIIPQLVGTLVSSINLLIPLAMQIIMALVNGIVAALPSLITGAIQIITAIVNGISAALPMLSPAVIEIVMAIASGLIDSLPLLLDAGTDSHSSKQSRRQSKRF
jgi:hypothetical protein